MGPMYVVLLVLLPACGSLVVAASCCLWVLEVYIGQVLSAGELMPVGVLHLPTLTS